MIPQEGDCVKYRVIEIPPTYIKTQAVQVTLMNESKLISDGKLSFLENQEYKALYWVRNNIEFYLGRVKWTDEREKYSKTPNTPPSTPI